MSDLNKKELKLILDEKSFEVLKILIERNFMRSVKGFIKIFKLILIVKMPLIIKFLIK